MINQLAASPHFTPTFTSLATICEKKENGSHYVIRRFPWIRCRSSPTLANRGRWQNETTEKRKIAPAICDLHYSYADIFIQFHPYPCAHSKMPVHFSVISGVLRGITPCVQKDLVIGLCRRRGHTPTLHVQSSSPLFFCTPNCCPAQPSVTSDSSSRCVRIHSANNPFSQHRSALARKKRA